MDKTDLTKHFAERLRTSMIASGFNSQRSTSGVSIHKLADITGYSLQICRKYLRGEAIPEPVKLIEIASTLQVSPGWLLFGDLQDGSVLKKNISINKEVLHYTLVQATCLYRQSTLSDDVPSFLMDLLSDISQINANEEQAKKIIDLAFSSAKHFSPPQG